MADDSDDTTVVSFRPRPDKVIPPPPLPPLPFVPRPPSSDDPAAGQIPTDEEEEAALADSVPHLPVPGPERMGVPFALMMPSVPPLADGPAADDDVEGAFAPPPPEDPNNPTAKDTLATCLALLTALGVAASQGLWQRARHRQALADQARAGADKAMAKAAAGPRGGQARGSGAGSKRSSLLRSPAGGSKGSKGSRAFGRRAGGGDGTRRPSGKADKDSRGPRSRPPKDRDKSRRSRGDRPDEAGRRRKRRWKRDGHDEAGGPKNRRKRRRTGGEDREEAKRPKSRRKRRRDKNGEDRDTPKAKPKSRWRWRNKDEAKPKAKRRWKREDDAPKAKRRWKKGRWRSEDDAKPKAEPKRRWRWKNEGETKPKPKRRRWKRRRSGESDTGPKPRPKWREWKRHFGEDDAKPKRRRWKRGRWQSQNDADGRTGPDPGRAEETLFDDWDAFKAWAEAQARAWEEERARRNAPPPPPPPPGPEEMRPPPGADRSTTVTVERVDEPRPQTPALTTGQAALPAGPAASPTAGPVPHQQQGEPPVSTPIRTTSTQYADAELTIHDVIDADADMAEEIAAGVDEARCAVDGCEVLLGRLEALHAEIVDLRVPGVLEGMVVSLMEKTATVKARAEAIAANLPAASEAIAVAGSNAEARHRPLADAVRDAGHIRPAEREYHTT
ncbi:hypothetical protein [Planobispora rosea]|uniref:hypothetical protein n=1 Tax=Planobispora rosea TaxID=35762 RepID=UPI00083B274C|nr:hypothetical protein [Planobispora rosea]